jgi:hypothetical protein
MKVEGMATICKPMDESFAIGYLSTANELYRLQFTESFRPQVHECIRSPSKFWNCLVKTPSGRKIGEIIDIQQPRSDGDVFELNSEWDDDVIGKRLGDFLTFQVESVQVGIDAERVVERMFSKMSRFENVILNGELTFEIEVE